MRKTKNGMISMAVAAMLMLSSSQLQAADAEFSASFKNTDIAEFVNTVGRNLNRTIIVDPSVRGKINVRSYDLLTEDQYYQFFLNVLEVYGFAVVEMDTGVTKVVKSKDAKLSAIPVVDGSNPGTGDEMVTRVVPVRNVSVRELAPLLRQLNDNAGGGNVVHYDPSNVLMITGRAAVVNRLVEIVNRVDKAGDQNVDIVRLEFASAGEMVRIIESLQKQQGKQGEIASLKPRIVADDRTNAVIISGDPKTRARLTRLIRQLDSELESLGNTRVFYLKYAKATEIVDVLQGVSESIIAEQSGNQGGEVAASGLNDDNLSIEAHEATNSLVITAQPDVMQSLESVINQLDIRRAQVQVEAIIVELAEGDAVALGIQWATGAGGVQFNDGSVVSLTEIGAGIYEAQDTPGTTVCSDNGTCTVNPDTQGDITALASALSGVNGMAIGLFNGDFGAVIQAFASDSNSNILATPSLTTLDNQEASFVVGEEVPILTGSTASSNNANPFQTVERKEVGIKLKVTPQINEGDAVQLAIEQEVSQVLGRTQVDVKFAKREVKTTVLADSGQTIVIGGLLDERVIESQSKVPLLGDIPILGHLFRSTSTSKEKKNLMVFIKPTILRDGYSSSTLSSRKYTAIRAAQIEQQERGVALMPNVDVPILPDWDQDTMTPELQKYMQEEREKALELYLERQKENPNG